MSRRQRRRQLLSVAIALGTAAVLSFMLASNLLRTLEFAATDFYTRALTDWKTRTGLELAASKVIIVAIDDASIQRLGRHGDWPRVHYAQVVDAIRAGGARGIAFDVGFIEPHADDPIVAEALQRFGTPESQSDPSSAPQARRAVISPVVGLPDSAQVRRIGEPLAFPEQARPRPEFVRVSSGLGHANVIFDADGTVRKMPLLIQAAGEIFPSLGLAAAAAYNNTLSGGFTLNRESGRVQALNRLIPSDAFVNMNISFVGPPSHTAGQSNAASDQSFRAVSFIDTMEGRVEEGLFRDKMAFIGLMGATGFADDYFVPTASEREKMHGVEIHANVFATLLASRFITEQQFPVTVGTIWVLCIAMGLIVYRFGVILSALVAVGGSLAYFGGAFFYVALSYDPAGIALPNPVYPPFGVITTYVGVTAYRVVFEQAEARAILGVMGKYLSPAVLKEVLRDPDKLALGGQKRMLTAMFTDIRGFTSISEQFEPEFLIGFLNDYLTEMTDIVYEQDGVLDKYMGDAIMAWWGAPTEQPDHAYRACLTALAMRSRLARLHQRWEEDGVPKMEMGIGVNTGFMVYGNTGSRDRFDFTVLGDAVNLASRLEEVNKEYGSNVIISESTLIEVADRGFVTRFLDLIAVQGKTEPVRIYELLGQGNEVAEHTPAMIQAWGAAMEVYLRRDFALAAAGFQRVLDISPDDGPARVYLERCQSLRESPPDPEWDGVFVMTHK